jgi:hypothetical protein
MDDVQLAAGRAKVPGGDSLDLVIGLGVLAEFVGDLAGPRVDRVDGVVGVDRGVELAWYVPLRDDGIGNVVEATSLSLAMVAFTIPPGPA